MVCMGDLIQTFTWIESTDMFSMYLQSGVPMHFLNLKIYCGLNIAPVFMFEYIYEDPKLQQQRAET